MKKISILIAVRNEENIILSCLENLKTAINEFYEAEKNKANFELEILLGDDNDENTKDKSAKIIKDFIEINKEKDFHYFKIDKNSNQNNLKGKVNVIYQLINYSKGESIILLDADIIVNPNWLTELVKTYCQNDKIKMVMGTTIPKSKITLCPCWCFSAATPTTKNTTILAQRHHQQSSAVVGVLAQRHHQQIFDNFQTIDWIFGQGILAIFSKLGFPQTAMGNNLIFDKQTYQEIGGYENMEFSVTEDVALFKAFQHHSRWWGHQQGQEKQKSNPFFTQLFNSKSLAFTEPEPSLKDWILQRHRWFCGAWQFSNFIKKGILLTYLFRIIFILGMIIRIILSENLYLISFIFISLGITYLLIISFFIKLKLKISLFTFLSILLFGWIEPFLYALLGIYFLKTRKVKWKEREF